MKRLEERIAALEFAANPQRYRMLTWSDDDVEELETVVARDRNATGFAGEYMLLIFVNGNWQERAGETRWIRPPRAAKRYVHAQPPFSMPAEERDRRIDRKPEAKH